MDPDRYVHLGQSVYIVDTIWSQSIKMSNPEAFTSFPSELSTGL